MTTHPLHSYNLARSPDTLFGDRYRACIESTVSHGLRSDARIDYNEGVEGVLSTDVLECGVTVDGIEGRVPLRVKHTRAGADTKLICQVKEIEKAGRQAIVTRHAVLHVPPTHHALSRVPDIKCHEF